MLKALSLTLRAMSVCVSTRQHTFRQHMSAYLSIRMRGLTHTPRDVCVRQHTSAYVSSAYVSIRQHTPAHLCVQRARLSSHAHSLDTARVLDGGLAQLAPPPALTVTEHTSAYASIRQQHT